MIATPLTDKAAIKWENLGGGEFVDANFARELELQIAAIKASGSLREAVLAERERCAIAAWDEERQRALREAARVIEANRLLDEAFGFVNPPLADAISEYLSQFNPDNKEENKP